MSVGVVGAPFGGYIFSAGASKQAPTAAVCLGREGRRLRVTKVTTGDSWRFCESEGRLVPA